MKIEVGRSYDDEGSILMGSERNSPRTKVAAKLRDLEIERNDDGRESLLGSSQSPRKRLKRSKESIESGNEGFEVKTPLQLRGLDREIPESAAARSEIGETPRTDGEWETGCSSPPTSPTDLQALRRSFGMSNTGQKSLSSANTVSKRMPSPPPPTPRAPNPSSERRLSLSPGEASTFAPDLPNMDESTANLASLTWQDNEITGHELAGSDDDGEGINGVGFRPTAQMAWVRSQKRKAQVEGWKNREAREARARRSERRRKGSRDVSGVGEGGGGGRRVVRFEGE